MPGRGSFSSTHTLRPRCATASAAARPTTPPPMTAVSICSMPPTTLQCRRLVDARTQTKYDRPVVSQPRRVLVTGSSGQLGTAILNEFSEWHVAAHTHHTLEITDAEAVSRAVAAAKPQLIVNCAAFN